MQGENYQEIKIDVLIIGSEAAGAKAAIEAQEEGADVLVVTKGLVGQSGNTILAGGGIQAPLDPRDSPDVFFKDVIMGGDYLNNQKLVERLVGLAAREVVKMEEWGAKFKKTDEGRFWQYDSPGATYPRSLYPIGLKGGIQWRNALVSQLKRLKTRVIQDVFIIELLLWEGEVAGAIGVSLRDGKSIVFNAKTTILATGGCSQVYKNTDSSIDATGDGYVLAYHAGAELMDMEFQQFFPMCCYSPPYEMSNLAGTLRYFIRGKYYNNIGEAFMEKYMPLAKDWGLRDPTSRAIYLENMYDHGSPHGGAYLSINHLPRNLIQDWIEREKPPSLPYFEKMGIDIFKDAIEVGPGAHYTMGGVRVNENCETTLPRLLAAGEVAAGMDGAERIDAGPAITWCLTMGYLTGTAAAKRVKQMDLLPINKDQIRDNHQMIEELWDRNKGIRGWQIKNQIKDIMWKRCALARDKNGLEEGLRRIEKIKAEDLPRLSVPDSSRVLNRGFQEALEAKNMVELAEMIIKAALLRKESRKSHYRLDFLQKDNEEWLKNIVISSKDGTMEFTPTLPIMTRMKPSIERGFENE